MKIHYFGSDREAIEYFSDLPLIPSKSKKLQPHNDEKYYKLASVTIKRFSLENWMLFKTVGLLFGAICHKQNRQLLRQAWKECKRGGEKHKLYVKKITSFLI